MEKQAKRRLSETEKIRIVKEFLEAQTSKTAFAAQLHMDRKVLGRWVEKYKIIAQQEIDKRAVVKTTTSQKMISISYFEYLELLKIKNKYDIMHSVIDA